MKFQSIPTTTLLMTVCATAACDGGADDVAADKAEQAAQAHASGKADQLDLCAGWDWYDDDFCDDPYGWCAMPDPDCGPDADSCAMGWTWSGRADEGCVEASAVGLSFDSPVVIGQRASTSFDAQGWATVAVDAGGGVHAVYSDFARRPTYARPDDGWTPHTLSSGDYVREGLTVAVGDDVQVAFVDDHFRLQHLVIEDGDIVDRRAHEVYAYSLAMAVEGDVAYLVHGAGHLDSDLFARVGPVEDTVPETVASFEGQTEAREGAAVAVRGGLVHALYLTIPAAFGRGDRRLRHAIRDASGTWSQALVPDATSNAAALAIGPDGTPTALYGQASGGERTLVLAEYRDGHWATEPLPSSAQAARGSALGIDDEGWLHVAYVDDDAQVRYLGRDPDGAWGDSVVVAQDASMSGEDGVSLALGPDGAVHLVYSDTQSLQVRYVVGRR